MCPADHFEIREYNIDRLEGAEERHAHVERRPYPVYPSKAGLKPSFLRDIIARLALFFYSVHNVHLFYF